MIHKDKNLLRGPHKLSNGAFLETWLSANGIFSVIKRMLKGCGYKETDIKIFVKD